EELDGDVAVELAVVGAVDGRHAALAEQLDQPIPAAENRAEFRHAFLRSGAPLSSLPAVTRRPDPTSGHWRRRSSALDVGGRRAIPTGRLPAQPPPVTQRRTCSR